MDRPRTPTSPTSGNAEPRERRSCQSPQSLSGRDGNGEGVSHSISILSDLQQPLPFDDKDSDHADYDTVLPGARHIPDGPERTEVGLDSGTSYFDRRHGSIAATEMTASHALISFNNDDLPPMPPTPRPKYLPSPLLKSVDPKPPTVRAPAPPRLNLPPLPFKRSKPEEDVYGESVRPDSRNPDVLLDGSLQIGYEEAPR